MTDYMMQECWWQYMNIIDMHPIRGKETVRYLEIDDNKYPIRNLYYKKDNEWIHMNEKDLQHTLFHLYLVKRKYEKSKEHEIQIEIKLLDKSVFLLLLCTITPYFYTRINDENNKIYENNYDFETVKIIDILCEDERYVDLIKNEIMLGAL